MGFGAFFLFLVVEELAGAANPTKTLLWNNVPSQTDRSSTGHQNDLSIWLVSEYLIESLHSWDCAFIPWKFQALIAPFNEWESLIKSDRKALWGALLWGTTPECWDDKWECWGIRNAEWAGPFPQCFHCPCATPRTQRDTNAPGHTRNGPPSAQEGAEQAQNDRGACSPSRPTNHFPVIAVLDFSHLNTWWQHFTPESKGGYFFCRIVKQGIKSFIVLTCVFVTLKITSKIMKYIFFGKQE